MAVNTCIHNVFLRVYKNKILFFCGLRDFVDTIYIAISTCFIVLIKLGEINIFSPIQFFLVSGLYNKRDFIIARLDRRFWRSLVVFLFPMAVLQMQVWTRRLVTKAIFGFCGIGWGE